MILCIYLCVCVSVCLSSVCRCPSKSGEDVGYSVSGVTGVVNALSRVLRSRQRSSVGAESSLLSRAFVLAPQLLF